MTEDVKNNNAIEALQRNLVLKIDEEVVPYTISAKSNNQFELIARPEKSYLATDATL